MDPLSVTASILAVTTATVQVCNVLIKISEARDAPAVIMALFNEVNDLRLVVDTTKAFFDQLNSLGQANNTWDLKEDQVNALLEKAKDILDNIKKWVEPQTKDDKGRLLKMASYLKNKSKLEEAQKELIRIRMEISNLLGLANCASGLRLETNFQQMDLLIRNLSANLQQGLHQIQISHQSISNISQKVDNLQITSYKSVVSNPQTTSQIVPGPSQTQLHTLSQQNIVPLKFRRPGTCDPRCACACHSKQAFRTPGFLSGLVGKLSIGYSGMPSIAPSCDIPGCKRASGGGFDVQYVFPQWFLVRMITMAVRMTQAPEVSIKTWNFRPGNIEAFQLVRNGNLLQVQKLFSEGQLSVRDVSAYDGETLLHMASYCSEEDRECDMIQFLLSQGADKDVRDFDNMDVGSFVMVDILDKYSDEGKERIHNLFPDIEFEDTGFTRIHKLVLGLESGSLEEELQRCAGTGLINKGDIWGRIPLLWAVERGDREQTTTLLENGADTTIFDVFGNCALRRATDPEIFKELISFTPKSHLAQRSPLGFTSVYSIVSYYPYERSEHTRFPLCRTLLAHLDSTDLEIDPQALIDAVARNEVSITELLLDAGVDVNWQSPHNTMATATLIGIFGNSHDALRAIFTGPRSVEIDHTKASKIGMNILHFLAEWADLETLEIFSDVEITGIKEDDKDRDGYTPMLRATSRINECWDPEFNDPDYCSEWLELFESILNRVRLTWRLCQAARTFNTKDVLSDDETDEKRYRPPGYYEDW